MPSLRARRRLSVALRDERVGAHVDAAPLELAPRVPRQPRLERRQQPVAALEQDDAHLGRGQLRVLVRQHQAHELGERARVLDAGRTAADDAERQQPLPLVGVAVVASRALEALEHVVAQLQRLAEILEPERVLARSRRCRSSSCVLPVASTSSSYSSVVAVGEPHDAAPRSRRRTTSPCRYRTFGAPRNTLRSGAAISDGFSRQLATWYSSGVNRW